MWKIGKGFPAHRVGDACKQKCRWVVPRQETGELARTASGCPLNAILRNLNFILRVMGKHPGVIQMGKRVEVAF